MKIEMLEQQIKIEKIKMEMLSKNLLEIMKDIGNTKLNDAFIEREKQVIKYDGLFYDIIFSKFKK